MEGELILWRDDPAGVTVYRSTLKVVLAEGIVMEKEPIQ